MKEGDYGGVRALYGDPEALRYMDSFFPEEEAGNEEECRAFFDSYVKHMYRFYGYGMYVLIDKRTDAVIGHVGFDLREDEAGEPVVCLGYLIDRAYRGEGLAGFACRRLLAYAREQLQISRVEIRVRPENRPSVRLARALAGEFAGYVRIVEVSDGR